MSNDPIQQAIFVTTVDLVFTLHKKMFPLSFPLSIYPIKELFHKQKLLSLINNLVLQWTLSNSNSQGEFEFVRIMESSD